MNCWHLPLCKPFEGKFMEIFDFMNQWGPPECTVSFVLICQDTAQVQPGFRSSAGPIFTGHVFQRILPELAHRWNMTVLTMDAEDYHRNNLRQKTLLTFRIDRTQHNINSEAFLQALKVTSSNVFSLLDHRQDWSVEESISCPFDAYERLSGDTVSWHNPPDSEPHHVCSLSGRLVIDCKTHLTFNRIELGVSKWTAPLPHSKI